MLNLALGLCVQRKHQLRRLAQYHICCVQRILSRRLISAVPLVKVETVLHRHSCGNPFPCVPIPCTGDTLILSQHQVLGFHLGLRFGLLSSGRVGGASFLGFGSGPTSFGLFSSCHHFFKVRSQPLSEKNSTAASPACCVSGWAWSLTQVAAPPGTSQKNSRPTHLFDF